MIDIEIEQKLNNEVAFVALIARSPNADIIFHFSFISLPNHASLAKDRMAFENFLTPVRQNARSLYYTSMVAARDLQLTYVFRPVPSIIKRHHFRM